jgi:hypothetical protein
LITGGGHGLQTGGGHGMQTGGGQGLHGQQVTTTGRHGRQQADAPETPANIATATINASNVFIFFPFVFSLFSVFI